MSSALPDGWLSETERVNPFNQREASAASAVFPPRSPSAQRTDSGTLLISQLLTAAI